MSGPGNREVRPGVTCLWVTVHSVVIELYIFMPHSQKNKQYFLVYQYITTLLSIFNKNDDVTQM